MINMMRELATLPSFLDKAATAPGHQMARVLCGVGG
jgi:hypothetical protein